MGNISVDYDVLNQKGSPAWYSDIFANIPTPGYKGRMFISTDTFAFYRDNGTGWDLTGGPGTGTITGAGVSGQLTYFIGTDVISGNNNLFYDITNGRLGINTATPGSPLDIHSSGTAAQFNGTTTNNAFVFFQNAGTSKWRIGNLYNSGANDYQIYDVLNATARLTIKNTGATTLTGTFTATSLIKSGGTSSQILLADGTTTPTSTFGAGSVTSVSAITLGTSGTDLSSSVANSTTTPVITLNVPTASATNRGALSSADWTTFNSKQSTITLTTTGTSGAATLVGATLNIPNYTNVGTVTSVAALTLGTTGTDLSSSVANSTSTPVITLNVPTASATNRGALSSTDWTTFNSKQATISVTAPVVLTGATISMPAATTSVSGYLTSTDWNTFNNKTSNLGTVTNVVALTIGTTGIDITSTAVTTTTTPVITLNIPTASASNRGALSSTDWTTFNNKQATLSLTTTGTSGAATLVANTLNIPDYGSALSGYVTLATTQTISGAKTFTSTIVATQINLGGGASQNQLQNAVNNDFILSNSGNFRIINNANTSALLSITNAGASSFSNSVSINGASAISKLNVIDGYVTVGSSANVTTANTLVAGYGYILSNTTYGNVKITSSYNNATNQAGLEFYTDNGTSTERLKITSGGVTQFKPNTGDLAGEIFYGATSTGAFVGDASNFIIGGQTSKGLVFCTNNLGQEKMRITTDGTISVGGFAPVELGSGYRGIQLQDTTGGLVSASSYAIYISSNAIIGTTGWVRGGAAYGNARYSQFDGAHTFYNAAAGSIGSAITWNTAFVINSSSAATFYSTLGINGTSNNVRSGTYTPTVTAGTNCAAVTAYPCQYMQVDKVVTVSGYVYGSATAITTETQFTMSTPVNTNFTQVYQCGGTGRSAQGGVSPSGAGYVASISANATNEVRFSYTAPAVLGTGGYFWFSFTYQII